MIKSYYYYIYNYIINEILFQLDNLKNYKIYSLNKNKSDIYFDNIIQNNNIYVAKKISI